MMIKRRVYVLDGKPEEDIAMAMAVTSRSPQPFDETLSQINKRRSSDFLEKFYINYGHGSIADTAFIHLACENISQIAVKAIENTRLAAYQEKSTRYQILDREHTVEPKELRRSPYHSLYRQTINHLFDVYELFVSRLLEQARHENKRKAGESRETYENRIRIPVIDRCRLILPAATMCNVGFTMSGRSIEYTVAKMLSSPLSEVRDLGREIKKMAQEKLPILVKYTNPIKYQIEVEQKMQKLASSILGKGVKPNPKNKSVELVQYDRNALERVLAASLERFSGVSYSEIIAKLKKANQNEKERIFDKLIHERLGRHDRPLRELETTSYTFDIVCDYGAYRDLQRHRMLTQTVQPLTTALGYAEPLNLDQTGLADEYHQAMEEADRAFNKISKDFPLEAQYLVPMAYRRRFLFHLNLREAIYLIELRSRPQGHISYRRIAWEMWRQIDRVHPCFSKHIKVNFSQ